jgi:hypothetical protein
MQHNFRFHAPYFPRLDIIKVSQKHPDVVNAKLSFNFDWFAKWKIGLLQDYGFDNYDWYSIMMSPNFHLYYKYLISTDGLNCAWSRVEWILFSNSLLLKD